MARQAKQNDQRGFLGRLLHDARGNTIAIMAAALIPLLGLIGGGVDMGRLYLTKARLQQACDAGALAGRKAMGGGSWSTGSGSPEAAALSMFGGNFQQGDYGTGTLTKTYSESNGSVSGTASVIVPMAVMQVFGFTSRTLGVNCAAKMEIPNTDVMFVLDITGSMNCAAGTNCYSLTPVSGAKITGLKSAVKCFYEALMKVNTSEVCGNDPTATSYTGTAQVRFGFVPYSVNVNVGMLLPNSYMADSWPYQSRVWSATAVTSTSTTQTPWAYVSGSKSTQTVTRANSSCPTDTYSSSDVQGNPTSVTQNGVTTTTYTVTRTETGATNNCYKIGPTRYNDITTYSSYVTRSTVTQTSTASPGWTYKQVTHNVSGLKAGGSNWNSGVSLPLGSSGANTNVAWDGCIEERQTHKISDTNPSTDFATIPSDAWDLDIDMVPSGTAGTTWGPLLNGAVWARYDGSGDTIADVATTSNLSRNDYYVCPTPSKKLQSWTASTFETYVDSLSAAGNTYHDIGMLWGARLISPTGIFASANTNLSNIQRHIIFMTDGDTNTNTDDYSAYGVHWWDRRQTTYAPSSTNTDDLVNARLLALCSAIKNKNITLWVISYGGGVSSSTESRLNSCATSGKYYSAANTAALISQFQQIASAISDLRLTN